MKALGHSKAWLLFIALMATVSFAFGQARDFPNRPVKLIVPFPAGAVTDVLVRTLGEQLAGILRQPVIVENRAGASGTIAVLAATNAPADGYTVLVASSSMLSVNPIVIKGLQYDPIKDLKPLTGLGRYVSVFVVPPDSKLTNATDLVAAAKRAKQPMNVGTYSAAYTLPMAWFSSIAGVEFTNVPYKGPAQMALDVMGNRLDFGYMSLQDATPLLKSGKLRSLGTSGPQRDHEFPDMPTIAESGFPEFVTFVWNAICVRAETPPDVAAKLTDALQQVLTGEAFKAYAKKINFEIMPLAPAAMQKFHVEELERFRRIAARAGIKPE